ncbi:30S ribosomal protein S6 [Candidatus Gottesmanbacteria bacterium]|nr:30S ribosomal protein S6 [Candidatus Gottesmanbacteria bacterium]
MTNLYELTLLLNKETDEEETKKLLEKVSKWVKEKGKVVESKFLGKKNLVYPIKKEIIANFWLMTCDMEGNNVKEMVEKFKLEDKILRYLFVKVDRKPRKPKVLRTKTSAKK